MSCESSQYLGPALITAGAKAFVGFEKDFLWMANPFYTFTPWDDPDAQTLMKPMMDGINLFLDGATVQDAFNLQQKEFMDQLATVDDEVYASIIQWDIDNAMLLGDPTAKLSTPCRKLSFPIPPPPIIIVP
jgi:hypothetical protein